MPHDNRTLADSINAICATHEQDPDCLTRHDLNTLDTLKREASWLLGESCRGPMNSPRHHRVFDRIHTLLRKLEKKCADYRYQKKWRDELHRQSKYNPYHKPAGSPEGGEFDFAPGGGGSASSGGESVRKPGVGERIWQETFGSKPAAADEVPHNSIRGRNVRLPPKTSNVYAVIRHAADNIANPSDHPHGNKECGTKVREAIEAGGIKIPKELRQNSAKDFGRMLTSPGVGFHAEMGVDHGKGYPPSGYEPKHGDVVVIQPSSKNIHGHTAIYAGKETYAEYGKQKTREIWISDYVQENGPYPNGTYRSEKPSYVIYRHPLLSH